MIKEDISKNIAGLHVGIALDASPAAQTIAKELSYYKDLKVEDTPDIHFRYGAPEDWKLKSNNPSSFFLYDKGMSAIYGKFRVYWSLESDAIPLVYFHLHGGETSVLSKYKGMQYTHPFEEMGQIFHEGILQPSLFLYFSKRLSLVHGSGVCSSEGSGIIFAGTGGVGKTSLELELILNRGYQFIADDISFVDNQGFLQPNFNFPKIYGYNLLGYPEVEEQLLMGRSQKDKFWWNVQKKVRKPHQFRRRAILNDFYEGQLGEAVKLERFVMLYRSNESQLKLDRISPETAAEMNGQVLYTELSKLHGTLSFLNFNTAARESGKASLTFESILLNTKQNLMAALEGISCELLHVPQSYTAHDVKANVPDFFKSITHAYLSSH